MNLFLKQDFEILVIRIQNLKETATPEWGILKVRQMLAHCSRVLEVATTIYNKQYFMGILFGKTIVRNILKNRDGMKKNIKSAKILFVEHPKSFKDEQDYLIEMLSRFYLKGPDYFENKLHPFFGRLTAAEWQELTYKHLDHHLSQFGC